MKLFGQIVRTVVNTAALPVALAKDVRDVMVGDVPENLAEAIETLKEEAGEDPDPASSETPT